MKLVERGLLPCPFCGNPKPDLIDDRVGFFVRCDECKPFSTVIYGESVRHLDDIDDDAESKKAFDAVDLEVLRKTAITAWNRRAYLAAQGQEPAADGPKQVNDIVVEAIDGNLVLVLTEGNTGWTAILDTGKAEELRGKITAALPHMKGRR